MRTFNNFPKLTLAVALTLPFAVCVLNCPMTVEAQVVSGDLLGTVTDATGAVVPNADIIATNLATGVKATNKTNANGEYHFVNLPVGHYSVQASGNGLTGGFADILVQLNKSATANVKAVVGSQSTTVEVTAQAATIDTTTQQIQNTFEPKQVQDLPTASVGLGVLNLSLLNAGVASSGGVGAGTGPSVSGQRPRNNNFTVEGVDNNSKSVTGPIITIPNDAVENFTVLQNQFSPEFGHSSGGQFNQTIRGGSNRFHGMAYEYFNNRNLNAMDTIIKNQGKTSNPQFDDNRYGGQIGGPIWRDKAFFFGNVEYNTIRQIQSGAFVCAPTAGGYATLAATPGLNANNVAQFTKYIGTAATVGNGVNCQPSYDGIATGEIDLAGGQYNNTFTTTNSVDFNISQSDQLRVRYVFQKNPSTDVAANLPTFYTAVPVKNHLFTLGEYHTFSPTVTNEFRLGFNRNAQIFPVGPQTYPGLDSFPNLVFNDTGNQIGPDGNAPQFGIQNIYQAVDNISWVKGKHTFKFGVEGRKYISPQGFTQRSRGDYEYNSTLSFFQDQVPDSLGQRSTGSNTYYGDQTAIYAYGGDQWRVTSNLTLDLGLRYEFTSVPFSERLQALNSAATIPGLISFNAPQPQYKNFAPRVGFAYSPGESGNTSIRGGFGIAYDVLFDNLGLLTVPPQFGGTCDVGSSINGGACAWNTTSFLAGGGLPPASGTGLQTFPTLADQIAATSGQLPNQQLPYSENWNLGVQHVFGKVWTAEVRYVGTRGIHLPVQQQVDIQPRVTATNFLPTFLTMPDAATIAGLTNTLAAINAPGGNLLPAYAAAGFGGAITTYRPLGSSNYNGLQTQLTRSFTNGLQVQAAYTWSHAIDDSTAEVFSTVLTPRRPQNSQDVSADRGTSALDRRHRFTLEAIYDVQYFKNSNWFAKNVLGNWEVAPVYTFQSPEYYTAASGTDSNLNGDTAPDRAIYNAAGIAGTGSGVTPLCTVALSATGGCPSADTVGYVAKDPNARFIQAGKGALANTSRNMVPTPRINNFDLTLVKRFSITEKTSFEFQAQALNALNHAQYIPGSVNTVNSLGYTGGNQTAFVQVNNAKFNQPELAFSNNPRILRLVAKFIF